jgi:hypothetical protein
VPTASTAALICDTGALLDYLVGMRPIIGCSSPALSRSADIEQTLILGAHEGR